MKKPRKRPKEKTARTRRAAALLLAWALLATGLGQDAAHAKAAQPPAPKQTHQIPFTIQQQDLDIAFDAVNQWQGGYQGEITLTNTGTEVINGWRVEFIPGEETLLAREAIASLEGLLNHPALVEEAAYEVEGAFGNFLLSGKLSFEPEDGKWEIPDFGLAIGSNEATFTIRLKDGTKVQETFLCLNSSAENMEKTNADLGDSDKDGINNYFESILGTDPENADTDGDGLTAVEELACGTSPLRSDSDLEGIDDRTEILSTGTDPLKEDTDGDGLTDGEELRLGTSPLIMDTNGNGIMDGEEKIEQQATMEAEGQDSAVKSVSVSHSCSGGLWKQLKIENAMETDKLSTGAAGLVGFPIEITSTAPFDEAAITFQYDEVLLVDKKIWLDAWRRDLNYDKGKMPEADGTAYDIFLCLDYSVSEGELKREKQFARRIIEQMVKGDRVKIGAYLPNTLNTYSQAGWMTDSKAALGALDSIETQLARQYHISLKPSGNYYSDNYQAIHMITDMEDKTSKNQKVGFLLNAGKNEDVPRFIAAGNKSQAEADLKALGFPVHSVSVTDKVNKKLEALLKEYGGDSFLLTDLDGMKASFHGEKDSLDMLDTDGDGVSDFDEVGGMPQFLVLSQNQYASTINYLKSDPNDPASTGRGAPAGYLLVDDPDYLPYSEKDYRMIFFDNTWEKDTEGSLIYGRRNIYNSNPDELTPKEVGKIRSLVMLDFFLVGEAAFSLPISFLKQYLDGDEDRHFYPCGEVLRRNRNARDQFAGDALGLMQAASRYLERTGETSVMLAQAPENQNSGVELGIIGKEANGMPIIPIEFHPNDFLAINIANTRTIGTVSFDGEKYTIDLKHCIFDYYDWDKSIATNLGTVSAYDLYRLCRCGAARFYENWGLYETRLSWEPGTDGGQEALNAEKNRLARWF